MLENKSADSRVLGHIILYALPGHGKYRINQDQYQSEEIYIFFFIILPT